MDTNYSRVVGVVSPNARTNFCIGLDLDECLVSIQIDASPSLAKEIKTNPRYMELRKRLLEIFLHDRDGDRGEGMKEYYWGIKRPHLDEFLLFLFSYFRIVFVWSAAQRPYVNIIVEKLFADLPYPYMVMNRDDIEHSIDGGYHKPLSQVMHFDTNHYINLSNTLFLDNKGDNFIANESNGITIPDYQPPANLNAMMTDDIRLLQVRQWLLRPEVMASKDVRTLDKSKIFTTPLTPITSTSPLSQSFGKPYALPEREKVSPAISATLAQYPGFNTFRAPMDWSSIQLQPEMITAII